jgi:hypothetical protein
MLVSRYVSEIICVTRHILSPNIMTTYHDLRTSRKEKLMSYSGFNRQRRKEQNVDQEVRMESSGYIFTKSKIFVLGPEVLVIYRVLSVLFYIETA